MENSNAKNRPTQKKQARNNDFGDSESLGGVLGTTTTTSASAGTDQIGVSGEDSQEGDSAIDRKLPDHRITGKIISQLIEKLQQQLAYHKQEVQTIEEQIEELIQFSENLTDKQ